jgi:hypothetical protein
VLGQDVERAIELVEGKIPGLGQPDLIEPALMPEFAVCGERAGFVV